jgi:CMP-N,N'-diacetyllegionaminic acid synthase
MSQPNCIALVTGRAGSKRFPGKHTRLLGGKPLIAWSIAAGLNAKAVAKTIVSTDSPEIAEVAHAAGADVPFLRPASLAGDEVTNCAVMLHALDWLEEHEAAPDILCLLQATSPMRGPEDLDAALARFMDSDAETLVSVTLATPPEHLYHVDAAGRAAPVRKTGLQFKRLQELPAAYRPNGAIYLVRPQSFRRRRVILCERPLAYVMPFSRSIDIDTPGDLKLAEAFLSLQGEHLESHS